MRIIICCLLIINLPLLASELKSAQSRQLAEQLVRSINQKLSQIAELEMAAGASPEEIEIDLNQSQRFDSGRFGAMLDSNTLGKVVSVTPKSPASKLGLRSGDVMLSVNDNKLSSTDNSWRSQLQFAKNNTDINIKLLRLGKPHELSGTLQAKYTPQWQLTSSKTIVIKGANAANYIPHWQLDSNGLLVPINPTGDDIDLPTDIDISASCGRAIIGKTPSKSAQDKFFGVSSIAVVTEIDGRPIVRGKTRHRLPAGHHTLKIGSFHNDKATNKRFTLTVQPNTNYYIAYVSNAKWEDNKGNFIDKKPYTGPVVYKTMEANCEL